MKLKTYIDLYELLKYDKSTPQDRRAFGLLHESMKGNPVSQLSAWVKEHRERLYTPLLSEKIDRVLYHVSLFLVLIAFVLGLFSGIGLLSYNGKEPVNLIYFLAVAVFLPLGTMTLSLFAMLRANRARNLLVHVSPAYWMERLLQFFSKEREASLELISFNPLVLNWIVIRRSQMLALAFSVGLLVALLGVVATRDVAFAWSMTLDLSDTQFHTFLDAVALPWAKWLPSAVPSLELVMQSHYFRLGGKLSEEMVSHAALLGTWWKFLVMATLFYAVLLRGFFYLVATWGMKRALDKAFLTLDGAGILLKDMNEPLITTHAQSQESSFLPGSTDYERLLHHLDASYDSIQGWSIPKALLMTICDTMKITASHLDEVGGNNVLEADREIIERSKGDVLLFVKAWEPPTMDFVDHLLMLAKGVDQVVVVPVGTLQSAFKPSAKEVDVWLRKIVALEQKNIWMKV